MNNVYLSILVMAVTTYLIRMLPLIFFKKKIENKFFNSFLYYVPYACLASMTFPAILYSGASLAACVVGLIVALFSAYKGASMVKVAIFACVAVYVSELLMGVIL